MKACVSQFLGARAQASPQVYAYASTFDGVLFQTVKSCPDLRRRLTSSEPMLPRPRNPIFKLVPSGLGGHDRISGRKVLMAADESP